MFTYKKAPYKFFALGPKFCWAGLGDFCKLKLVTGQNWKLNPFSKQYS